MRLGFWQKLAVYSTTAAVGISGLLWFLVHDVIADEADDLAHLLLVTHGVSAYALLVAVGSLLPLHVRSGWRRRRNFAMGLAVTATIAVLGVTALMLYYGSEETQAPAKWAHLIFGLGCFIVFPAHAILGARKRQAALPDARRQPAADLATESGARQVLR